MVRLVLLRTRPSGLIQDAGDGLTNFNVTVVNNRFLSGISRCDTKPLKDFYTACGGAVGIFTYGDTLTNMAMLFTDNVYYWNSAEYGKAPPPPHTHTHCSGSPSLAIPCLCSCRVLSSSYVRVVA